jgi:hypothetical protein
LKNLRWLWPAENRLTKSITIIALTCLLVAGAAVTGIFARDNVASARSEMASPIGESAVSNKQSKTDRLLLATEAPVSLDAPQTSDLTQSLRMAFTESTADSEAPRIAAPKIAFPPASKPKPVAKPQPPKPTALLSDEQIANIKQRLRLSSAQEYYWPAVEDALRAVGRRIHATRKGDPNPANPVTAQIDPDAEEVQQLKSAAMPLLFQLREDQKQEVRTLARLIGLEKVAAQI